MSNRSRLCCSSSVFPVGWSKKTKRVSNYSFPSQPERLWKWNLDHVDHQIEILLWRPMEKSDMIDPNNPNSEEKTRNAWRLWRVGLHSLVQVVPCCFSGRRIPCCWIRLCKTMLDLSVLSLGLEIQPATLVSYSSVELRSVLLFWAHVTCDPPRACIPSGDYRQFSVPCVNVNIGVALLLPGSAVLTEFIPVMPRMCHRRGRSQKTS